jgi:hypothetical protein
LGLTGRKHNEVKFGIVEMQEVRLLRAGVNKGSVPSAMEKGTSTIVSLLVPFVKKYVEIAIKEVNSVNDRVK